MTITTNTRNAALWARILPDVVQFLNDNPLASCSDAAKRFGLNHATLASRIDAHYPGQFDFVARRKARGDLHRKPKRVKPTQGVDLRAEFDAVLAALARIEAALAKPSVSEPDLFDALARSRE